MPELLNPAPVAHLRHLLRAHSPLVHCMTNDVVQTFTANVLLAVGASPGDGDRSPTKRRSLPLSPMRC